MGQRRWMQNPKSSGRHRAGAVARRWRLVRTVLAWVSVALIATTAVLAYRAARHGDEPLATTRAAPTALGSVSAPTTPTVPPPSEASGAAGEFQSSFAELADSLPAEVGIASRPLGAHVPGVSMGVWSSGPAWSTAKVPLVLAALREQHELTVTAAM